MKFGGTFSSNLFLGFLFLNLLYYSIKRINETKNLHRYFCKMKTEKDFDAIKMMQEIREKRQKEYELNPELREKRLKAIRKKYSHKI